MEESTYQEHHTMKRVTLKSSSTNLNGESRINYNILGGKYGKTLDFECTPGNMLFMGKYGCR